MSEKQKTATVKKEVAPKLRIKLKSYDMKMLESSLGKVVGLLIKSGAEIKGPIPLPKKRKLYTVLRANFKFKDSREQFEIRTHKRLIDILGPTTKTIDALTQLQLPSGVEIDIR